MFAAAGVWNCPMATSTQWWKKEQVKPKLRQQLPESASFHDRVSFSIEQQRQ